MSTVAERTERRAPTAIRPTATDAERLLSVTAVPDSGGRVVVRAVGEVDTYTAPLLELCVQSQADRPSVRELVVDLRRVSFLGAAGVSVLVRASRRCRARDARFTVRGGRALSPWLRLEDLHRRHRAALVETGR